MRASGFERIRVGLEDAIAHTRGSTGRARVRAPVEPAPDVALIRAKLGVTQEQFADLCGVSVATLRNWEQGRRRPAGPSRALLTLVDQEPEAALRAIRRRAA
jgi:putative transcriptional regulator